MNKISIKNAFVTLFLSASSALFAQNIAINPAGTSSNPAAILDLSGNPNLGFLMPEVSLTSSTSASPISLPPAGLVVYDSSSSTANGLLGRGFYYWSGIKWLYLLNSEISPFSGDIGASSYLARYISPTELGTGVTQDNGTGVGISASPITPLSLLDVNGGVAIGSYAGNNAAPANSMIVSGNVGVGTSTPQNSLDATTGVAVGAYAGTNTAPSGGVSVWGQVGIGTSSPNAAAALDVTSSTQGILIPRMPSNPASTSLGVMYYNTTTNCFVYWTGTAWQNMACACSGAPSQPGSINGITTYSQNQTGVSYSISPVTGAVYYTWSVPTGATITTGQGTTSITVTFGTLSGNVSVTANNSCAASAPSILPVMVNVYYVPITITNTQTTATPNNFVQMITVNSSTYSAYESSGLQNIEFTTGASGGGTPLYSWVESGATSASTSTVYWVNLATSIAASGTYTIYMNFMPTAVMASTTSYTGTAPQLFGTGYYATSYGQYDNGASVFPAYFNGNTPTTSFVYSTSGSGLLTPTTGDATWEGATNFPASTPINALNFYQNGQGNGTYAFVYSGQSFPTLASGGYIAESSYHITSAHSAGIGVVGIFDGALAQPQNGVSTGMCNGGDYFYQCWLSAGGNNSNNGSGSQVYTPVYGSVLWPGGTVSTTPFYGYNAPQLYSTSGGSGTNSASEDVNPFSGDATGTALYLGIHVQSGGNQGDVFVNWMRARPNPPNGTSTLTGNGGNTMPTVSFGSVQ